MKTKVSIFLQILKYTITLSVPNLISGDLTSFFAPSRLIDVLKHFSLSQFITTMFSPTPRVDLKKIDFCYV